MAKKQYYEKYTKKLLSCAKTLTSKTNWWGPDPDTCECTSCQAVKKVRWILQNTSEDFGRNEDPSLFFELLGICLWLVHSYPYVTESCINEIRTETKGCPCCRAIEKTRSLLNEILED